MDETCAMLEMILITLIVVIVLISVIFISELMTMEALKYLCTVPSHGNQYFVVGWKLLLGFYSCVTVSPPSCWVRVPVPSPVGSYTWPLSQNYSQNVSGMTQEWFWIRNPSMRVGSEPRSTWPIYGLLATSQHLISWSDLLSTAL